MILSRTQQLIFFDRIMRICALLPLYAILSFLAIAFPNAYVYLIAWVDFFQAIALCAFFLLVCDYISPSQEERAIFFAKLQPKKGKGSSKPLNGLAWFQVRRPSANPSILSFV